MKELKSVDDFPVDSKVILTTNRGRQGIVVSNKLRDPNMVAVDWDDGELNKVNVDYLLTVTDLEEEFKLLVQRVDAKLELAASLILEAADLAKSQEKELISGYGYESHSDFNTRVLENAMDKAGWSTSSWYC